MAGLLQIFRGFTKESQEALNSQDADNPLCKQKEECVGWGVDGLTGEPRYFPLIKLTYTDASKTFNGKREPVETDNTPVINRRFTLNSHIFGTITEFINYVNTNFVEKDPPSGSCGI
jgi:hypothetical protein